MIIDSTKTAIKRNKPSKPAQEIVRICTPNTGLINKSGWFVPNKGKSILDWGCGFGDDIYYYQNHFSKFSGYEINPKSFYNKLPTVHYKIIACTYVLCTIPLYQARLECVKQMLEYLQPKGRLYVSARTEKEINRLAKKKNWAPIYDGYLTSLTRKTFQHGVSENELKRIADDLNLDIKILKTSNMPNTIMAEFRFKKSK
jgi:chorismate mutase